MFRQIAAALVVGIILSANAAFAQSDWRQIGVLQSESRNLSVGKGIARVVSAVKFRELYTEDMLEFDTLKAQELYPGWDKHSDVVMQFEMTDSGFQQIDWWYAQNVEKTALEGDTISTSLGIYDQRGTRHADIPADLKQRLGDKAHVVAASFGNIDRDAELELAIVVAGPWDTEVRGALNNVSLFDHSSGSWQLIKVFELDSLRRSGPIEIRDVTGDGKPDVVYRSFWEEPGRYYIDAHIFSTHAGVPESTEPPEFNLRLKKPEAAKQ